MPYHYEPYVQVRENALLLYDVPALQQSHHRNTIGFSKAYSGQVSEGAERRIRKAVDIFLQSTPKRTIFNPVLNLFHDFRLGFVTLTVASEDRMLTAREGHAELLRPWLRWVGAQGVKNYIWKAELQERGQIHWHVTVDNFVHYQSIQNKWNQLQKKAGLLDGYAKKVGHFNPNSTDVHSVRNIKNFEAYLAKYLAKAEQNQQTTDGKVWDCSADLKKNRFSAPMDSVTNKALEAAISKGAKVSRLEHCTIISFNNHKSILSPPLRSDYLNWLS